MQAIRTLLFALLFSTASLFGTSAHADKILVLGISHGFMQPNSNLHTALSEDGHEVTVLKYTYPTELATVAQDPVKGYDQVWVFMNEDESLSPDKVRALRQALINYLADGGRIYLQSEVSCCHAAAAFVKEILTQTLKPTSVLPHFDHSVIDSGGLALINDTVAGPYGGEGLCRAVSTLAYRETSGVRRQNQIVTSSDNLDSTVAAFYSQADLMSGRGRIVVNGDINFYGTSAGSGNPMPEKNFPLPRMFANLLAGREVPSHCPLAEADHFALYNLGEAMQTPSVLANDQENRFTPNAATANNVLLTSIGHVVNASGSAASGISLDTRSGIITVQPSVPNGTYRLTYQICQVSNPISCVADIATLELRGPVVDAADDDFTATPLLATVGGSTTSVLANDRVNGAQASSHNTIITPAGDWHAGVTMDAEGVISVSADAAAGDYALGYQICMHSPHDTICDTAIATLTVNAVIVQANDDDHSSTVIPGGEGGALPSVLANDTVDGITATPSNAQLTMQGTWPDGITMGADGVITIGGNAKADNYALSYQICAIAAPTACSVATVTFVVEADAVIVVQATDDDHSSIAISSDEGGSLPSVLANDTVGGVTATPSNARVSTQGAWPNGIAMGSDGAITIAAQTAPNRYALGYQICAIAAPAICDAATATFVVQAPAPQATTPVPTLQQWAVMALATILGGLAALGLRHRTHRP